MWMSEEVWLSGGIKCLRKEFLVDFADSIRVWMKTLGYTMEPRLYKELSMWLYRIYVQEIARKRHGRPVYIPEPFHRDTQDDRDQYEMVVSHDTVSEFMDEWSSVQDMDVDSFVGKRVWYEIHEFLYSVINLDASKQGRFIASIWDNESTSDSEHEYDRKKDVYIEDANKGFHGGWGMKV